MLTLSGNIVITRFIPQEWGHGEFTPGNVFALDESLVRHKGAQNPFKWITDPEIQSAVSMPWWHTTTCSLARANLLTIDQFQRFVDWCEAHQRTSERAAQDANISSVDLWLEWLAFRAPGLALHISHAHRNGCTTDDLRYSQQHFSRWDARVT